MSQSLTCWLFDTLSSVIIDSLSCDVAVSDLPYVRGSRVQVIKFLTFRPVDSPNQPLDIWALIGDRTHMIAARFSASEVTRFQQSSLGDCFTSLRGAVIILRFLRPIIEKVDTLIPVPWSDSKVLAIDVRGFDILGSIGEPIFFPQVRLVTSERGIPVGREKDRNQIIVWINNTINNKKKEKRKRQNNNNHDTNIVIKKKNNRSDEEVTKSETLPTPAQRHPPPKDTSLSLWQDFDLDAQGPPPPAIDLDFWTETVTQQQQQQQLLIPTCSTSTTTIPPSLLPPPPPRESDSFGNNTDDTDESGISDYERECRRKRKRIDKPSSPTSKSIVVTVDLVSPPPSSHLDSNVVLSDIPPSPETSEIEKKNHPTSPPLPPPQVSTTKKIKKPSSKTHRKVRLLLDSIID